MIDDKMVSGIILLAGNSIRYGKNINKNFEKIKEKYIFQYSLEQFLNNRYIDDIILAVKKDEKRFVEDIVSNVAKNKKINIIFGGKNRKESVYNCISKTNSDIVIIQDGARPLIKQEYINKCIESMKQYNGASIAVKSKDTIKITDKQGIVINTTQRNNTWIVQTPQCFNRKILIEQNMVCTESENITDDCMLLEQAGYSVKLIEGDNLNIKLTNLDDYKIINSIID